MSLALLLDALAVLLALVMLGRALLRPWKLTFDRVDGALLVAAFVLVVVAVLTSGCLR